MFQALLDKKVGSLDSQTSKFQLQQMLPLFHLVGDLPFLLTPE